MKEEDKIYIEIELSRIVSIYIEDEYDVDRLGNIIFRNKLRAIENIKNSILQTADKIGSSKEEIQDYLIKIYEEKLQNPNFIREGTELISILKDIKNEGENKKEKEEKIKNKNIMIDD